MAASGTFRGIFQVKVMRIRKAVSITEYPAIGKISVRASTLLVVVLFIYIGLVWIVMKWIVYLEDKFRLLCPDHF